MVTTIKITCDGVFIQTNSNHRIHTTDNRIVNDSSMNVINDTNISNGHSNNINKIKNEITKRSISLDDIDVAPQSLPNLPITNSQPALISPQLVKTLSRIKKTTSSSLLSSQTKLTTTTATTATTKTKPTSISPTNGNKIVINGLSSSSVTVNKSIHKVIRIDKNGQCITTPMKSSADARQWDGCTNKKNGTVGTVRRRNTFKNYLIECKENIVRRLSSPTSPIG